MHLVDFQVSVRPAGLSLEQQKAINAGLFPVYEAVRLWLKEQKVTAPFRKIVISLADRRVSEQWQGKVMVALSICEVTEAVLIEDLLKSPGEHYWTCSLVLDGLEHMTSAVGWHCQDLVSFLRQVGSQRPPCSHRFSRLSKRDKSGLVCDVVLEADLGLTAVKVQFSGDNRAMSEIVVASRPGPLFLEDDFPIAATKIDKGHFVLMGKDRAVLAQIAIPS